MMTASAISLTRRQRTTILAIGIAIHLALVFVILTIRSHAITPPIRNGSITLVSLGQSTVSKSQQAPVKRLKTIPRKLVTLQLAPAAEEKAAEAALPAAGCSTLAVVSNALLNDPAAVNSIIDAPPESRSVADAVVLWNAGWSVAANAREAPLSPARAAIEKALSESPPGCLQEEIAGPRFVPVPAGERTIFIVLGSGQWNWQEMLAEPLPQPGQPTDPQSKVGDLLDWLKG